MQIKNIKNLKKMKFKESVIICIYYVLICLKF